MQKTHRLTLVPRDDGRAENATRRTIVWRKLHRAGRRKAWREELIRRHREDDHELGWGGRVLALCGFPVETGCRREGVAWLTGLLLLANIAMYLFTLPWPDGGPFGWMVTLFISNHDACLQWGMIPDALRTDFPGQAHTLLSSMFMHANLQHLLGNMWVLFVVGDDVERRVGRVGTLLLYLVGGVFADGASMFFGPAVAQGIPHVGASGAIATLMGMYLVLMPRKRLHFAWFLWFTIAIPAPLVLGLWLVQESFGLLYDAGPVNHLAHLAGFFVGFLAAQLVAAKEELFAGRMAGV